MKMFKSSLLCLAIIATLSVNLFGTERADIIVAQDGSGDFIEIQEAINSIPTNNTEWKIILIKNGDYEERVLINRNHIALVGEDREETRIYYNLPREGEDYDDQHRAPVTIYARDIILANLTIENTQTNRDIHAFTVYGGGDVTRVMTINCDLLSYGGDTVALWNAENGMYYHRDCRMRGAVDFLCPRGWAYAENIDFNVTRETAVLWHQGSEDKDQKFVIKDSRFSAYDGSYRYDLGRHHYDAAFYLLNNTFSSEMKDKPIYRAEPDDAYQWPDRNYYYNNTRIGGDYEWFENNLQAAAGQPTPSEITPGWTFDGQWNPREAMPAVLPFADWPMPRDSTIRVALNPELSWIPGRNAESHNVYFGTSPDPGLYSNVSGSSFSPGPLDPNTEYFWRVDVVSAEDTVRGQVWHFHTRSDQVPPKAVNPSPADGASVDPPVDNLTWEMDSVRTDSAKVYLGSEPGALELVNVYPSENYDPEPLTIGETYYWRVDLVNQVGVTEGDVWEFQIASYGYSYADADYFQSEGEDGILSIEAENYTDSTVIGDHRWERVDSVAGYSGSGAVQVVPPTGKRIFHQLYENSSRLDYVVNFTKADTHYIWIRQYNPRDNDQFIHLGLNYQELASAKRIGDFDTLQVWEWAHYNNVPTDMPEYFTPVSRTFDVQSKGVQVINLWFGEDGTIVDKIVLTTNPNYIPEGEGPGATTDLAEKPGSELPGQYQLHQNYPNPFNPATTIRYTLPARSDVTLEVYNMLGRKVATLVNTEQPAGRYSVRWEGVNHRGDQISTGVYLYRLRANEFSDVKKMVFIR